MLTETSHFLESSVGLPDIQQLQTQETNRLISARFGSRRAGRRSQSFWFVAERNPRKLPAGMPNDACPVTLEEIAPGRTSLLSTPAREDAGATSIACSP